jgi:hypothetical protein
MNDKIFTLNFELKETLQKADYRTFSLWAKLETCKNLEDVVKTMFKIVKNLHEFVDNKLEGDKEW